MDTQDSMLKVNMDKEFFRSLAENSHDIIHKVATDLSTIYINPRIKYYTGNEPVVYIGKRIFDLLSLDKEDHWNTMYETIIEENRILESTYIMNTIVGERTFHIKMIPEFNIHGQLESILSISTDITEIEKTVESLKKNQNLFKISTENLLQPFVILTPVLKNNEIIDFGYEYINEAGVSSIKISFEETIGSTLLNLFPLHKELGIFDRLKEVFTSGISWKDQIKYKGPAGNTQFDGYFHMTAAKAEDKVILSWIDLTNLVSTKIKLEKALHDKDLLIKEVHHRVKNNLQIITSILNLQSNYIIDTSLRETFMESQNRIKSIALVHEKLYKSDFLSFVNLHSYLKDLGNNILFSYNAGGVNIDYVIDEIPISNEQVIILGLITTEIISSIIKLVFPPYTPNSKIVKILFIKNHQNLLFKFSHNGKAISQDKYEKYNPFSYELLNALVSQLEGELLLTENCEDNFCISFAL